MTLNPEERKWLFMELWGPEDKRWAKDVEGYCFTCGARTGECMDITCIRTRVTNKLGISRW